MESKTVLFHHRTRANGAEGVHIRGIMSGLREAGFTLCDLSLVKAEPHRPATAQRGEQGALRHALDLVASRLPNILFKLAEIVYNVYPVIAGGRALRRLFKEGRRPRFMYERYAYFAFGMTLLSRLSKIPLVIEVNTTCLDYDVREIRLRGVARVVEGFVFRRAALIVVVSGYLRQKIVQEYGVSPTRIVVTPNAVDPGEFSLEEYPAAAEPRLSSAREFCRGAFVIGFIGVFVPWHGLDFLLQVFEELVARAPSHTRPVLLLVGDGPVRGAVEKLVEAKGFQERVHLTGIVPHAEIKHYIRLFDIAVMPDSNPFGSPMKIFEYMALGRAVVAPSYGPITEVISDMENGCLFPPREPGGCCEKFLELLADPQLRATLGGRAREDVLRLYTWSNNVSRIVAGLEANLVAEAAGDPS